MIQAWPVVPPPADHLDRGLSLVASAVRRDPANPIVTLKTTSRADYVFARLEARRAGAEDAVFLTLTGHLSESTTANIFLVRTAPDGVTELATPALDCAILPGTTRSWLLRWASGAGLRPFEGWLTPDELAVADEAFLSSSVAGVLPVTRFNGHPIGEGRPGRWTLAARAAPRGGVRGGRGLVRAGPGHGAAGAGAGSRNGVDPRSDPSAPSATACTRVTGSSVVTPVSTVSKPVRGTFASVSSEPEADPASNRHARTSVAPFQLA